MASTPPVPPITNQFPIVDGMGKPTDYFIRWLQERGFQIDGILTPEQVTELIQQWAALRSINTGAGLSGGGTLDNDLTLALNAVLNNLNDVDTVSTPPTDGQTLTYNAGLGLWIPGAGGGGGGGGTWEVASDVTISSPIASVVVDVQAYSEVEILIQNVTASASGSRSIQVSTDGGVTWWTTNGNYTWYNFSGVLTNNVCFSVHGISTSAARGGVARITNLRDASAPKVWQTPNNSDHGAGLFVGSNDPITHVRILNVSTGNLTGGRVVVSGLVA